MTVYIDQYILINIIINFIILRLTKALIKSKTSNPRLWISSIIGSLFALLIFIPKLNGIISRIIFSLILTGISFKSKNIKDFIKNIAIFYLVSFAVGGCGYALLNSFAMRNKSNTIMLLCTTVFISYFVLNTLSSIYEKHFKYDKLIHTMTIKHKNETIETDCFYDTGNNLQDPFSKKPVIVTDISAISEIIPKNIADSIKSGTDVADIYISNCTDTKFKLIPYHTISTDGFILGFVPQKILLDNNEVDAIIGISPTNIAYEKNYHAIANPQII